jgi:hypothetical protein
MPVSPQDRKTVEDLVRAMQTGPAGEEALLALFDDDSILIEPFSGQVQTHTGLAAIRESFRETWKEPLPDMALTLGRVDIDGDTVRAEWTCSSSAFPTPMRGVDRFDIRAGKIRRLEIVVTDMPAGGPPA